MSVRDLLQQCSVESQRSEMKLDNSRTIYKVIVDILAVSLFSVVDLVWLSDHISEPCIVIGSVLVFIAEAVFAL